MSFSLVAINKPAEGKTHFRCREACENVPKISGRNRKSLAGMQGPIFAQACVIVDRLSDDPRPIDGG